MQSHSTVSNLRIQRRSYNTMSPCPKKVRPLCAWCGVVRVKLMKNECCDESCAAALRWQRMKESGKIRTFEKASFQAQRTALSQRLHADFIAACKDLGITPTPAIKKLFVRARNKGYHAGFATRDRRARYGKEKKYAGYSTELPSSERQENSSHH